jgi:hypothetical protein
MRTNFMTLAAAGALLVAIPAAANAADSTVTGAAGGAVAGAVVGGPVGLVVGGVIGAVVGTAVEPPPPPVVSYVEEQPPPPPVVLQGDLVVGSRLPPNITLYPVPSDVYVQGDRRSYAYAVINGHTVVVDPQTYVVIGIVG